VLAHEAAAHAIEHDMIPRAAVAPFAVMGD